MNRHQRRLRAKAKPVRLPPPESDDYKVLRLLVAQMPMVQQAAELEQIDVLEAADGTGIPQNLRRHLLLYPCIFRSFCNEIPDKPL
jgi:hypothetical protein